MPALSCRARAGGPRAPCARVRTLCRAYHRGERPPVPHSPDRARGSPRPVGGGGVVCLRVSQARLPRGRSPARPPAPLRHGPGQTRFGPPARRLRRLPPCHRRRHPAPGGGPLESRDLLGPLPVEGRGAAGASASLQVALGLRLGASAGRPRPLSRRLGALPRRPGRSVRVGHLGRGPAPLARGPALRPRVASNGGQATRRPAAAVPRRRPRSTQG